MKNKAKVFLDLSQGQETPEGKFIGYLYYNCGRLLNCFNQTEQWGYPHNGGLHSLHVDASYEDVEAFLLLVEEEFQADHPYHEEASAFLRYARKKLGEKIARYASS